MPFRKERDRLKDIDNELTRIKKDLLHIDKSLKSLNKVPPPTEEPPAAEEKKKKEPAPAKAKPTSKPKSQKKKHKAKKR